MIDFAYPHKPIGSLQSLSQILGVDKNILLQVADNPINFYKGIVKVPKKNGTYRDTWNTKQILEKILMRINSNILTKITYPIYLQGCIRDDVNKRHNLNNAKQHIGSKLLISIDIKNFFPSTTYKNIYDIWKYFFNFPHEVAECLAKVTTLNNSLPQGANTSSYLANLVFWEYEPALVKRLEEQVFRYTRFVDDIAISSLRTISKNEISQIIKQIWSMLCKKGYQINRKKLSVKSGSKRMSVTGIVINTTPSLPKEKESIIRMEIFNLEKMVANGCSEKTMINKTNRISGLVGTFAKINPNKAQRYKKKLKTIKQNYKYQNNYLQKPITSQDK